MIFSKFREAIRRERETLPAYFIKFNRTVAIPFLILFLAGPFLALSCCIPLGIKFEGNVITFIPLIVWGVALLTFAVLYAVLGNKVVARFIDDYAVELEEKFGDMTFEEAKAELIKNKVINEDGFVCGDEDLTKYFVVPFNQAKLSFGYNAVIPMSFHICVGIKGQLMFDNAKAFYTLDKALYIFIIKNDNDFFSDDTFNIITDENFELFKQDKKAFLKKAYKVRKKLCE